MTSETPKDEQLPLFSGIILEEYEKGKDELNLAEFPMAVAGKDPARTGQTSVQYRDIIRDKRTGAPVERVITIEGSEMFGLPTYYDEEVLFGVLQLTNLQRRGDDWPKEVRFSRYHLAKVLGLETDGRTYRRLWDSLHRLANTKYNFQFSFFDKQDEEWRPSVVINFIQTLIVHGGVLPGKNGDVTVRWNEDIHRNFQAGYLRNINVAEYRSIGLPLAKALYRYLGKHFHRSSRLQYDLHTLAFEKLGLSRSYNVGQIKRALDPAIEKLEKHRFIKPATREQRYHKIRPGQWRVIFEKESDQEMLALEEKAPVSVLEGRLIASGVTASVAADFVSKYPAEVIERKIDELEYLVNQGKGPSNSGGWLAKSIRESWEKPSGYRTPDERAEEAAEVKKKTEAREEARARRKAAEDEKERLEIARMERAENYLKSLTPSQRQAMEEGIRRTNPLAKGAGLMLMKGLMTARALEILSEETE